MTTNKAESGSSNPETFKRYTAGEEVGAVVFAEKRDNVFVSSAPDRKAFKLDASSPKPVPGKAYTVRIVSDTEPKNPAKGAYEVLLIAKSENGIDEQARSVADARVDEAVKLKRQAAIASTLQTQASGSLAKERKEGAVPATRVGQRLNETERLLNAQLTSLMGPEGSIEHELADFRKNNLFYALRENQKLDRQIQALEDERAELLKEIADHLKRDGLQGPLAGILQEVESELELKRDEKSGLDQISPEAFLGLHLKTLKEARKEMHAGKIVETPYVKKQAEDVVAHARAGVPVFLYGHLGAGKTELAMHVARKYMGKEALVISGSKHMSQAELYGHQVLALEQVDDTQVEEYLRQVEEKYDAWLSENADRLEQVEPSLAEAEKNRAHDRIVQAYLSQMKSGTISEFFLGPVYQAMEEGRPVIIDEVNAIPHEVLISLNHLLTRRSGDEVAVQQDSGKMIKVADGFTVMMTGNLNQGQDRYVDRQELDPAFLSRLYKLEHDYLPQAIEGTLAEAPESEHEQFLLLVAKLMDKNGNLDAPEGTMNKLWDLAKAARVTQNVFSGKNVPEAFYYKEGGARASQFSLRESVLSIRGLNNIFASWQADGYSYELDHYIWKEFVSQATIPAERAYLYQLFKDHFGFFQTEGWEKAPDYGSGGTKLHVESPENKAPKMVFTGPKGTVEAIYGPTPQRSTWPPAFEGQASGESIGSTEDSEAFESGMKTVEFAGDLEDFLNNVKGEIT